MSVIFAILLFSFLILIHELGHFIAAKASGVQVNEFALFMGPAIFKKKIGETVYSLRCIPIGGYCAMEGENDDSDSPRSFQKAAWWKRLIILVAGAAMNFVAGLLLFAIIFMPQKEINIPVIDYFEEECTLQGENGLQVGDEILEIDGEKIYVSSDVTLILTLNPGEVHDLVVRRDGQKVELNDFTMKTQLFPGDERERYGLTFKTITQPTLGQRLAYVWANTVDNIRSVRLSLRMLITGQAGLKDLSGPVGIVDMMSDVADASETTSDAAWSMLYFGGLLAVNLAVMNLLPLPALDGGRVVALLITGVIQRITKKKLDPKYEAYVHAVGMILLLALMAIVMFKDIFYIFKG